jgi:protein ImuA
MACQALAGLRAEVARLEGRVGGMMAGGQALAFGLPAIDRVLPGGGLARGALHEVGGGGAGMAPGNEAALAFLAGIAARLSGPVLWVVPRMDLFAPGLATAGLAPERVLFAEAPSDKAMLAVMEEGLRHAGLAAVIGEVARIGLTPSRRLHLAAGASGVTALLLCRQMAEAPSAAVTRWRVAGMPRPRAAGEPWHEEGSGLTSDMGRARWRLDLLRCRGGAGAEGLSWMVEACDAQGRLDLVAGLADGSAAPGAAAEPYRAVG